MLKHGEAEFKSFKTQHPKTAAFLLTTSHHTLEEAVEKLRALSGGPLSEHQKRQVRDFVALEFESGSLAADV